LVRQGRLVITIQQVLFAAAKPRPPFRFTQGNNGLVGNTTRGGDNNLINQPGLPGAPHHMPQHRPAQNRH
jgi:hypothetical protein